MKDLVGQTFLVTGANTGIGLATACDLALRGGRLYIACRSEAKGRAVVDDIVRTTGNAAVAFLPWTLPTWRPCVGAPRTSSLWVSRCTGSSTTLVSPGTRGLPGTASSWLSGSTISAISCSPPPCSTVWWPVRLLALSPSPATGITGPRGSTSQCCANPRTASPDFPNMRCPSCATCCSPRSSAVGWPVVVSRHTP